MKETMKPPAVALSGVEEQLAGEGDGQGDLTNIQ
jgi:hypothetical protein